MLMRRLGLLLLVLPCTAALGSAERNQQHLQMLSHYDGTVPAPAPLVHTDTYNPLFSTADHARTWSPNYPSPYSYERVEAKLAPACQWRKRPDGLYKKIDNCDNDQLFDVSVELTIKYAIIVPPKTGGVKAIGDSPAEDSPPPFVNSVTDGEGAPLPWNLFREDKQWYLHYKFSPPVEARAYYTVRIDFQLQQVLQGDEGENKYRASWLSEWNAPVKEMHITWAFPKGFAVDEFHVEPRNAAGEGEGGAEGEIRAISSVCCGQESKSEDEMERCTSDQDLGAEWAKQEGQCKDKVVVVSTALTIPESEEEYGAADDGVQSTGLYEIKFKPGLVENKNPAGVREDKVQWWVWLLVLIVAFPCIGAILYTLAAYGPDNFFYAGWLDSCWADRRPDSSEDMGYMGAKSN